MLINVIQFDEKVGLGTFEGWLLQSGCSIRVWRADRGELPPAEATAPILLLGGYMGVNEREQLTYLQRTAQWSAVQVAQGRALLGICLGGQLLAHALGGRVHSRTGYERGICQIELTGAGRVDPLFAELPQQVYSFEWHNDSFELPPAAVHLAKTATCDGQAFRVANAWGVQFHPEVNEQVVADWCQRTGAGELPLEEFRKNKTAYYRHSRRILENFLACCRTA